MSTTHDVKADDPISTRDPYGCEHDLNDVAFYWGVASGGTHAALHRARDDPELPTPERLMVSYATQENGLWPGVKWMVDCGGAPESIKANGGHPTEIGEYVEYLRDPARKYARTEDGDVEIEQYALRDWPCEPSVRDELGLTVDELQQRTLEDHIKMLELTEDDPQIDGQPVAVLQGWEVDDYLECLDLFRDHGLLTDAVGIGSVCRKNTPDMVDRVRTIGERVRRNLPARVDLHGFGLKQGLLGEPDALRTFDTVDSAAWDQTIRHATRDGVEKAPPVDGLAYEDWDDWDDRGNPRYTWANLQTCFVGYREKIRGLKPRQPRLDDFVTDLSAWYRAVDELDRTDDADGYPLLKCHCGTVVDPGRPDPVPEPGCRTCERYDITLWDRRVAARESTLLD